MSNPGQPAAPKDKSRSAVAAREHARQVKAERLKRERRRRLLLTVGAPVLVVVLIIAGFIVVKVTRTSAVATGSAATPAGTTLESALKNIPAATFDTVGAGTGVGAPTKVSGAALTADSKPRVLYIGAEFCPYCAGERWAVVAALSRFGTFSNLGVTTSASADIYPSTATLSFHSAAYASTLLSFTGVELTTNIPDKASSYGYQLLDTPTATDQQTAKIYNPKGSIPCVDFGNKYVIAGASYDVGILQGMTQTQIAAEMAQPDSAVAQQVLGAANMMTAALCTVTGNQPDAVCTSAAVTAVKLPS